MKKYKLLLVISALILALLGAVAAFAAISVTAKLNGPSTVRLGDTVTLEYKVTCGEIYGMEADLSEIGPISRLSVTLNQELAGWEYNIQNGKFILYSNDFATAFSGEGKTLFTIKYKVTDNAKEGDTIAVKLQNCLLANPMSGDQSDAFSVSFEKTIQRPLSGNANLSSLTVDGTAVSDFDAAKTEYAMSVPYGKASIEVSAVCADKGATYAVSGNNLKYGENTVTVRVTAESGATKDYVIKVTRQAPPDLARLSSLSAGSYALEPAFDSEVFDYTVSVPYTKKSISFSHTAADGVKVNVSGGDSLEVGENTVSIKAVDQHGNEKTYTVTVIRRKNNNTNLLKLAVEGFSISPAFDYTVTDYTLTVPSAVTKLNVSTIVAGDGATAAVTGNELAENGGIVVVTVTAMDGSTKEYKITVSRPGGNTPVDPPVEPDPPSADAAKLTSLSVKDHSISPKFAANTLAYTLSVPNSVSAITVNAKGEDGSEVVISGADNLKVGDNKVKITVKVSGKEDTVYTITVTRAEAAPVPGSAKLQSITLSTGTLSPVFNSDVFSYIVYLPYEASRLTVNAVASENATVKGTGEYTLMPGSNSITLQVETSEGSAIYTVIAYVLPAFDGSLPTIGGNTTTTVGGITVIGGTQVGGKLIATYDTTETYMVRWFRDGKAVGGSSEYVVSSADLGKILTVTVYDAAGNTLATKTISVPGATASLGGNSEGFDTVGMTISLVAALATLVIGYILGKMRRRHHR